MMAINDSSVAKEHEHPMNSTERMQAAIRMQPVDRIPNAPFYEAPICRYFGSSFREALLGGQAMVDTHLQAIDTYQFDWVMVGMGFIGGIIPEALGCDVTYPENEFPKIERTVVHSIDDIERIAGQQVNNKKMDQFLGGISMLKERSFTLMTTCPMFSGLFANYGSNARHRQFYPPGRLPAGLGQLFRLCANFIQFVGEPGTIILERRGFRIEFGDFALILLRLRPRRLKLAHGLFKVRNCLIQLRCRRHGCIPRNMTYRYPQFVSAKSLQYCRGLPAIPSTAH